MKRSSRQTRCRSRSDGVASNTTHTPRRPVQCSLCRARDANGSWSTLRFRAIATGLARLLTQTQERTRMQLKNHAAKLQEPMYDTPAPRCTLLPLASLQSRTCHSAPRPVDCTTTCCCPTAGGDLRKSERTRRAELEQKCLRSRATRQTVVSDAIGTL